MKTIKWSVSITLMLALVATVARGFTIDGTADTDYGSAIVTQKLGTSTFKNTETNFDSASGSELDAAYGVISNGVLYLVLAGNMDSGDLTSNPFDKLNIFFMTGPGGDHTLGTNYSGAADFGHINNMGINGGSQQNGDPGLTFDTGFAANYWIGITVGPAGAGPKFNVNYEQICAFCPGAFLGAVSNSPPGNVLTNAAFGVIAALNNSNTNGVQQDLSGCEVNGAPFNPQNVRTGVELAIPLAAIGNPTGQVSVCAFITDDQYASMYNQVLGPIWDGTPTYCQSSFGTASSVDFSALPGTHTFTLAVPPCNAFLVSPASASYGSSGGASNVTVADVGACSWNATSSVPWIVITSGASGVGNGTVTYSVSSNTSINARSGTLSIVGQFAATSVSISQAGLVLPPLSGIIIDGTVDPGYGCPVAVQLLSTTFGKNTSTNFINATGSELDAAYGLIKDNVLFLVLAGNIQANGNRVHIFFMTGSGGQNTLTNVNPNVDVTTIGGGTTSRSVLSWMGPTNGVANVVGPGPGLTFDAGFAPNYWMDVNCNSTTSFYSYAQLWPGGTNASGVATNGYFLGRTGSTNGTLVGGTNPFLIQATLNNGNTNGVDAGNASMGCYTNRAGVAGGNAAQALTVTNGIEIAIPLAALGSPTGTIAICTFIANNTGLQLSDQILGSFGTNDPTYCLLGPGRTTNSWAPFLVMSNYPGQHFFYVGPEMRVTNVGVSNTAVNVSYLTENNTNLLYRVERITGNYSTNSVWVPVTGFTPGTGGIITQTDSNGATNKPGAFYRVRQSPNCQ
ncbi:MAG TPA: BACON domain-containing protein [Verrucomicrobiae bacterium]|nr:BACON domain-containing protein [Verrucomicrobiae bacterium]